MPNEVSAQPRMSKEGGRAPSNEGLQSRLDYLRSLSAEIRILARAIANDPDKRLSDLKVTWQDSQGNDKVYDYRMIVKAFSDISEDTSPFGEVQSIGLLQAVKDELISRTRPATGLTIAYTALVTGSQRTKSVESSHFLARQAYGNLEYTAIAHRLFMYFLAVLALLLSIFAAWESTKVSLGKSLLQVLEPLRAQQAIIIQDKFRLEESIDKNQSKTGVDSVLALVPVCDRYRLLKPKLLEVNVAAEAIQDIEKAGIHLHPTAEVREVCGRDEVLARNFGEAYMGLERFRTNWPDMVGGLYAASADVLGSALRLVGYSRPARSQGGANSGDIEFRVAPVVQAISSYVLPFTFGVIGSLLYVLLQHYTDLRANTLSPKEFPISWLRVILGFVVAACVSLLITSYAGPTPATQSPATGASPPQDLVGSLSLSASGVTFLAGFGAEAVFKLLQTLVERVFQTQKS